MSMMRLSRKDGAVTEVDASSCFDKIPPSLMSLAYCKGGLSPHVMQFLSKALLQHQYHTVTSHGVSDEYNYHSEKSHFYGPGQGLSDGTVAWALTHDKIDKVYSRQAGGAAFTGMTEGLNWRATMGAFVDDVTLYHMGKQKLSLEELESLTSEEAQLWVNLLWAASGKANMGIDKTYTALMRWAYNKNGTPFLMPQQGFSPKIREPPQGPTVEIHAISPYEAKRSLGVWKSKDLTSRAQLEKLQEKQEKFSRALLATQTTPYEALQLYRSVYYAQICYPLPSTSLQTQELQSLQSSAVNALLQKVKLPVTFPRAVVFAPTDRLGLGIPEIGFHQGYTKLQRLMSHLRLGTQLGTLMKIVLEWYQQQAGIQTSILRYLEDIDYVYCPWVAELRRFLRKARVWVDCPSLWVPGPQREGDECVMDKMRDKKDIHLEQVNAVRIYHKIVYVSDIATLDGRAIIMDHTGTLRETLGRVSRLPWPEQQEPGKNALREWKRALKRVTNEKLKLVQPLGRWHEDLDSEWKYKIAPASPDVIERTEDGLTTTHQYRGGGFKKIFDVEGQASIVRKDTVPAPTVENREALYVRGETNKISAERIQRPTSTSGELWRNYFVKNVTHMGRKNELNIQLQTPGSQILLVTDGGAEEDSGYYGWVIATSDSVLITGTGRLACANSQLQSLRPETTSYLACTAFLGQYLGHHNPRVEARITHFVDNMTVVRRMTAYNMQEKGSLLSMTLPDMDIQLQVQENLEKIFKDHHVTIQTKHVKGHQDRTGKKLTWQETLNVKADSLADESKDARKPEEIPVPAQKISLWADGHMLTTKVKEQMRLRWGMTGNYSTQSFLCKKYGWGNKLIDTIDWEVLPSQKIGVRKRAFVASYTHQWLPLNERLKRRGAVGTALCPICDREVETDLHFLCCKRYQSEKIPPVEKEISEVMKKFGVDPLLRVLVVRGLRAGRKGEKNISMRDIPAHYRQLVASQQALGWE